MNGCPYIAGPACSDCDGSCWSPRRDGPPEPTADDYCAGAGHPMDGFDTGPDGPVERCYCGARTRPILELSGELTRPRSPS